MNDLFMAGGDIKSIGRDARGPFTAAALEVTLAHVCGVGIDTLSYSQLEVVEEIIIVHEHETEAEAAKARAGTTRGKKQKSS